MKLSFNYLRWELGNVFGVGQQYRVRKVAGQTVEPQRTGADPLPPPVDN